MEISKLKLNDLKKFFIKYKKTIILIVVVLLICYLMKDVVEGYVLDEGGEHCSSRYIDLGQNTCIPDVNDDEVASNAHESYCSTLMKPENECSRDGRDMGDIILEEDDKTAINLYRGDTSNDGIDNINSINAIISTPGEGTDAEGTYDETSPLMENYDCKVGVSDSCSSLTSLNECENEENKPYCYWVDCRFQESSNPFSQSIMYNYDDYTTIQDWATCVETHMKDSGKTNEDIQNFKKQINRVGTRAHFNGSWDNESGYYADDGDNITLKDGVTLPTNSWGNTFTENDVTTLNSTSAKRGEHGMLEGVTLDRNYRLLNRDGNANPDIFPNEWKNTINKKKRECKSKETDGVIGWDNSLHNIKCLNYDSTIKEVSFNINIGEPHSGCGCPENDEGDKVCSPGQDVLLRERLSDPDCNYIQAGYDSLKSGLYNIANVPSEFIGSKMMNIGSAIKSII